MKSKFRSQLLQNDVWIWWVLVIRPSLNLKISDQEGVEIELWRIYPKDTTRPLLGDWVTLNSKITIRFPVLSKICTVSRFLLFFFHLNPLQLLEYYVIIPKPKIWELCRRILLTA